VYVRLVLASTRAEVAMLNDPVLATIWTLRFLCGLGGLLVLAWLWERRPW
jgi:hypothetical protein